MTGNANISSYFWVNLSVDCLLEIRSKSNLLSIVCLEELSAPKSHTYIILHCSLGNVVWEFELKLNPNELFAEIE